MKALITYFTQTGNTEKVGKAICEELSKNHQVDFKLMADVGNQPIGGYDLLVVGTPIHSGGLPEPVRGFLQGLNVSSGLKMAAFVTHMSAAYQKENFDKGLAALEQVAREKSLTFLGSFDCQGKLAADLQPLVQKHRKIPDDVWKTVMDETNKHPDAEDLAKAKAFARDIAAK